MNGHNRNADENIIKHQLHFNRRVEGCQILLIADLFACKKSWFVEHKYFNLQYESDKEPYLLAPLWPLVTQSILLTLLLTCENSIYFETKNIGNQKDKPVLKSFIYGRGVEYHKYTFSEKKIENLFLLKQKQKQNKTKQKQKSVNT